MKYLKTYEKYKFNIDDYVKVIGHYDDKTSQFYQKIYKITRLPIEKFSYYKIDDLVGDTNFWSASKLEKATPKEVEKYLLKINANKYNI